MISVASENPVKIRAAQDGFSQMFPDRVWSVSGLATASGVSEQPMSNEETYQGALNRLHTLMAARPDSTYWVGIEGGLEEIHGQLAAFAWVLIASKTGFGKGRTATFFLAPEIAELVRGGMEMGHADDQVFGQVDSKRSMGATGILTAGAVDRAAFYAHAVVMALIPFRNMNLYETGDSEGF